MYPPCLSQVVQNKNEVQTREIQAETEEGVDVTVCSVRTGPEGCEGVSGETGPQGVGGVMARGQEGAWAGRKVGVERRSLSPASTFLRALWQEGGSPLKGECWQEVETAVPGSLVQDGGQAAGRLRPLHGGQGPCPHGLKKGAGLSRACEGFSARRGTAGRGRTGRCYRAQVTPQLRGGASWGRAEPRAMLPCGCK